MKGLFQMFGKSISGGNQLGVATESYYDASKAAITTATELNHLGTTQPFLTGNNNRIYRQFD